VGIRGGFWLVGLVCMWGGGEVGERGVWSIYFWGWGGGGLGRWISPTAMPRLKEKNRKRKLTYKNLAKKEEKTRRNLSRHFSNGVAVINEIRTA